MERWGPVLYIFLISLTNPSFGYSTPESELWQYGQEFFDLQPVMSEGKIHDLKIVKKYSLKELCRSKYRFQKELIKIKDFLDDFGREVYRSPAKIKFHELTIERNKILLKQQSSIDRFERKALTTRLSQIGNTQANLLSEIETWKVKLASVFKMIVRLNYEGDFLSRIQFIHPSRNFFESNKPGTTIYVQYNVK